MSANIDHGSDKPLTEHEHRIHEAVCVPLLCYAPERAALERIAAHIDAELNRVLVACGHLCHEDDDPARVDDIIMAGSRITDITRALAHKF